MTGFTDMGGESSYLWVFFKSFFELHRVRRKEEEEETRKEDRK
jgi:hypothetical protein